MTNDHLLASAALSIWDLSSPDSDRAAFAIQKMERAKRKRQSADKALPEVAAERGRVVDGEADVFVEVEAGDAVPVYVCFRDESGEHFELRRPGGDDDVGLAARGEGVTDELRAGGGG